MSKNMLPRMTEEVWSLQQSRAFDRWAIDELGVSGLVLMENASSGAVRALRCRWPDARRVLVLVGPGNNGGDGLAMARLLCAEGIAAEAVLLGGVPQQVPGAGDGGDAAEQLRWAMQLDIPLHSELPAADRIVDFDVVVDALFGSGLTRPLEGTAAEWVDWLEELPASVGKLAVDLPSGCGLAPELRSREDVRASADLTVTFAALKRDHLIGDDATRCGEVRVVSLGVAAVAAPETVLRREADGEPSLQVLAGGSDRVAEWLGGPRPADSHKGSYGHLLLVGGSALATQGLTSAMSGAVALAGHAAVRSGVGLLTAAVPGAIRPEVAQAVPEMMTLGTEQACLTGADAQRLLALHSVRDFAALAIGPGLGRDSDVADGVRQLLEAWFGPSVVDADALNALGTAETLAELGASVLTPHPGELARLLETTVAEVERDRLAAVTEAARRTGSVVVLKGHRTLVAEPAPASGRGRVWVNRTGNPGMATGGTGDVLTGILGALLARGLEPWPAACCAVFLHGRAGDLVAARLGQVGLGAGDLADDLAEAFQEVEAAGPRA